MAAMQCLSASEPSPSVWPENASIPLNKMLPAKLTPREACCLRGQNQGFTSLNGAPVMSLLHEDTISIRQEPLEKFQDLSSPVSGPMMSRLCDVSNAMAVMASLPCASLNLQH
jgi:hypothetical protein